MISIIECMDFEIKNLKSSIESDIKFLERDLQVFKLNLENNYSFNDFGQFQSMLELEKKITKYSTLLQTRQNMIDYQKKIEKGQ